MVSLINNKQTKEILSYFSINLNYPPIFWRQNFYPTMYFLSFTVFISFSLITSYAMEILFSFFFCYTNLKFILICFSFIIFILIESPQLNNVQMIFLCATEYPPPSHAPCFSWNRKFPDLESANGVINALQRFPKVFTHAEKFCIVLGTPIRT